MTTPAQEDSASKCAPHAPNHCDMFKSSYWCDFTSRLWGGKSTSERRTCCFIVGAIPTTNHCHAIATAKQKACRTLLHLFQEGSASRLDFVRVRRACRHFSRFLQLTPRAFEALTSRKLHTRGHECRHIRLLEHVGVASLLEGRNSTYTNGSPTFKNIQVSTALFRHYLTLFFFRTTTHHSRD